MRVGLLGGLCLLACGPAAAPAPAPGPPASSGLAAAPGPDAAASCAPGDQARLTIVTGELPAGCGGGEYAIDGVVSGRYPVSCAPVPAGTHVIAVASAGDCAGMGACELTFEPGRETVHDLSAGCRAPAAGDEAAGAAADCERRYRRGFRVDLGRGAEELRAIPNPHWSTGTSLNMYGNPCAVLGDGWRVAMGSYSQEFLPRLQATGDPELRDALTRCPVTYRNLDTVCAPCLPGRGKCPCARRDVSDWLFCTR